MSDELSADVIVIGGGVVGCAVARALARRGLTTMLLEQGPRLAEGVTSRNSGVIHAGIYYAAGSRKADACVCGARLLYAFCNEHGVPHARVGKWIVGRKEEEAALLSILERAHKNGASGVRQATRVEYERAVPEARGGPAGDVVLHSPDTGIVDATELTKALAVDAERHGAFVLTHASVTDARRDGDAWHLSTSRGPIRAARVVNAAGLHVDDVARMFGVEEHSIRPVRGDYVRWNRAPRFTTLVYPAPVVGGLGVHVTIDIAGAVRLGPDVTWDVAKDAVGPPADEPALLARFAEAGRKLFPALREEDLSWESAGIRPKRRPREGDGKQDQDFHVGLDAPGLVNLVGIESPGLTAALALAEDASSLLL